MNQVWSLTDVEFYVALGELYDDYLPPPLTFRTRIRDGDEFARLKIRTRERLWDSSLKQALMMVVRPEVRVGVYARDGHDDENPAGCIRMLAVMTGERGVLVSQHIGETIFHSTGFTVTACDSQALAGLIVSALPDTPAGRLGEVELVARPLDYSYGRSATRDSFEDSVADRNAAYQEIPLSSVGMIRVSLGRSDFGPRGVVSHQLLWHDKVGDGRYLVTDRRRPVATPVDSAGMRSMIDTEIAKVSRAVDDENGGNDYQRDGVERRSSSITEDPW